MSELVGTTFNSPVGTLRLLADELGLCAVLFPEHRGWADVRYSMAPNHTVLRRAMEDLEAYFAGAQVTFSTPLNGRGTEFQRSVWRALTTIPAGETRTYAEIASSIGKPRAIRAVGAANARNPLSIFVPCHRVIGADGTLTGYAGGLTAKQWLLDHERQRGSQTTTGISRSVQDWYIAKSA